MNVIETYAQLVDGEDPEVLSRIIRSDVDHETKRLMTADVAYGVQPNRIRFNQDGDDIVHRTNVLRDTVRVWRRSLRNVQGAMAN